MKYLFLFFTLFSFVLLNAQSNSTISKDSAGVGLSESELKTAKEGYVLMMASKSNLDKDEYNEMIKRKLKGVDASINLMTDKIRNLGDIREVVKKKLTGNIHKTDFTSVEEGVEAIMKSYALYQKIIDENKELYALLNKATVKQQVEIAKHGLPKLGY